MALLTAACFLLLTLGAIAVVVAAVRSVVDRGSWCSDLLYEGVGGSDGEVAKCDYYCEALARIVRTAWRARQCAHPLFIVGAAVDEWVSTLSWLKVVGGGEAERGDGAWGGGI